MVYSVYQSHGVVDQSRIIKAPVRTGKLRKTKLITYVSTTQVEDTVSKGPKMMNLNEKL